MIVMLNVLLENRNFRTKVRCTVGLQIFRTKVLPYHKTLPYVQMLPSYESTTTFESTKVHTKVLQ